MQDLIGELRRVRLFTSASDATLSVLAEHTVVRRLDRGQILFRAGDPVKDLYVVRAGKLRVYVSSPRGDELVLAIRVPGQALDALSVIDGQSRSASSQALEPVGLFAIPASCVRSQLWSDRGALLAAAVEIAAGMRQLTDTVSDLVFLDLPRRLAKFLLSNAVDNRGGSLAVTLPGNQSGVAAQLGVTRQSLNRALAGLGRRGWIDVHGAHVQVRDAAALRRFAIS
ncbi:MAG: Crp/Fnr family transcriptional regulator [Actinomycetota bacterium]|nr:Crp/Fnr family transcriptional regulator [Actinomycetota bacterium]